jgi:hypothetical protein
MTIQGVSQIRTILMKAKSGRVFHKIPKLLPPSSMKRIHSFFLSLIVRGESFSIRIVPKGISEPKRILSAEAGTQLKINGGTQQLTIWYQAFFPARPNRQYPRSGGSGLL